MFNQTSQNSAVASRTSAKMTLINKNNKLGTYYINYMMCAKPKSLTNVPSFVDVAFVSQNSTNTIDNDIERDIENTDKISIQIIIQC